MSMQSSKARTTASSGVTAPNARLRDSNASGASANTQITSGNSVGSSGDGNKVASTSQIPGTTSSKKQGSAPTLDTLTATLQNSSLSNVMGGGMCEIRGDTLKKMLLTFDGLMDASRGPKKDPTKGKVEEDARAQSEDNTSRDENRIPDLHVYLHDRIWAHGGEAALRIGIPRGEEVKENIEGVEIAAVPFSAEELDRAIGNVTDACKAAGCEAKVLFKSHDEQQSGIYAYLMLRRIPAGAQELLELRIAVIGNVDAGKSSTLGVLTKGGLDDGRGKARVNLFRHKHEVESGRTSSVGMEIMGFDTAGEVVMNAEKNATEPGRKMSWEEVCEKSAKVITFIDLAGHERYLKTTVGGLTGCLPDFVMLMVGANAGLIGMSKEHLGVALALSVPVLVCITKVDMTPPHILEATIKQLSKILRSPGCRKAPIFVENQEQAVETALRLGHERICPIFEISNVTGQNLPLLRSFLNVLPQADPAKFSPDAPFKFQLQDVFSVPFVGCVVSGVILSGVVRVGDNLMIGPDTLGQFTQTSVRSIQRKRVNVDAASAGQSASFALKRIRRNQVRKGMVMLSRTDSPPKASMTCDAEILCLYHSTTLSVGSCMVLHAASIRQTVRIIAIARLDSQGIIAGSTSSSRNDVDKPVVRTGDRAMLRLQFIRFAEYVENGTKIVTREGKTKLIGVIRGVGLNGPLSGRAATNGNENDSSGPTISAAPPANATATASA